MNYKTVLKLTCSFILLAILFHEIHLKEVLPYFKQITFHYLLVSAILLFLSGALGIVRWILIMHTLEAPRSHLFYMKSYFKGITFNQVLPSSIGGDGYRMLDITKLGITRRLAVTSVLSDRIFGFAGLLIQALFFLPQTYQLLPLQIFLGSTFLIGGSSVAIVGVYCFRWIKVKILQKHARWVYDLSETLQSSADSNGDLCYKLILSIITNLLNSMSFYFIALSLGIPAHLMSFIIIIPLVTIVMMVPISIAGWGVREGALVLLGGAIGITPPAALAISLLNGCVLIANSLPGLYFYTAEIIREHRK